jgi:hypothetical protein
VTVLFSTSSKRGRRDNRETRLRLNCVESCLCRGTRGMECVSGGTKGGVQYMGYGAMARLHASVREATPA